MKLLGVIGAAERPKAATNAARHYNEIGMLHNKVRMPQLEWLKYCKYLILTGTFSYLGKQAEKYLIFL